MPRNPRSDCSRRRKEASSSWTKSGISNPRCKGSCCVQSRSEPCGVWADSRSQGRRSHSRRHQSRSSARGGTGPLQERPLLSSGCHSAPLPPLRERGEDALLLADHFIQRFSVKYGKDVRRLDTAAKDTLLSYPWPGNVRELSHVIERAVLWSRDSTLTPDQLSLTTPSQVSSSRRQSPPASTADSSGGASATATGPVPNTLPWTCRNGNAP